MIVNTLSAECNIIRVRETVYSINFHCFKHVTRLLFSHCQDNGWEGSGLDVTIKTKCFVVSCTELMDTYFNTN